MSPNMRERILEKVAATYYHGSPNPDIKELRAGSYVTRSKRIAKLMGRYHTSTGKPWSDDDLAEPHYLGRPAKFKEGRRPEGKPVIYALELKKKDLDLLGNPYEHKTLKPIQVTKTNHKGQ